MTIITYESYIDIITQLSFLHPDYDYEEYNRLAEELGQLEGFPINANINEDIIVPVLPENTPPMVVLNVGE